MWPSTAYTLAYLAAIVCANLSVAAFGKWATIVNALLFVGLDLTTRDHLHDAWHGRHLWRNMGLLILAGALLTLVCNFAAWRIALASLVAFTLAAIADVAVYHRTRSVHRSNLVSAAVDSIIFPTLAFASLQPLVTLGQYAAKVIGGWLWATLLHHIRNGKL